MSIHFRENLTGQLTDADLRTVLAEALGERSGLRRVLLIHPDYTRNDFTGQLFPLLYEELAERGLEVLETLNASGTHRAMTQEEILRKLGIADPADYPLLGTLHNHEFANPDRLKVMGEIPAAFVAEQTRGQLSQPLPVTANRLLTEDWDLVLALSGVLPHEAAGYAGALKVFFPGCSGPNVIDVLHWAAVLIGIPRIIGSRSNPAREVINAGSRHIFAAMSAPTLSLTMIFEEHHPVTPKGFYAGFGFDGFVAGYEQASEASAQLHVRYIDQPLQAAVQVISPDYDEVWTAGKGSYKLQRPGVMAPGGQVIIFAPHITCFHSDPGMDRDIRTIGYHCLPWVIDYLQQHPDFSRNVASHVANVRGPGEFDPATGQEQCAFDVVLAMGIPEDVCHEVGLGYCDPATLREADFTGPDRLWIGDGGKLLYSRR